MITLICLLVSPGDVMSLHADDWASKVLISDSCIVGELPMFSAAHANPPSPDGNLVILLSVIWCPADSGQVRVRRLSFSSTVSQFYAELQLTEEEQKLLSQEGVSLPTNLPLTKVSSHFHLRSPFPHKQTAVITVCVRRQRKESWRGFGGRFGTNSQLKTAGGAGRNTLTRWRAGT